MFCVLMLFNKTMNVVLFKVVTIIFSFDSDSNIRIREDANLRLEKTQFQLVRSHILYFSLHSLYNDPEKQTEI